MQQEQTIAQKRLWYEKEFRLDDGILHLKEMGLFGGHEIELRYEDILSQKTTKNQPNLLLLLSASFLMLLSISNLAGWINNGTNGPAFWGVVFALGMFYVTYKSAGEMICLETIHNRDIQFFRDPDSKRRTDRFIDELLKERKLFMVEKYWDCANSK